MERTGKIEIRVFGKRGNVEITPETYDIKDIISVLQDAEHLIFPDARRGRPTISYSIEKGSVRHVFTTALQVVIGFNAILLNIEAQNYSIDFLESPTAKAFESLQESAKKHDLRYEVSTSLPETGSISIDRDTTFIRSDEIWVDAEFYFYGLVTDFGGKDKANIHLDTTEAGNLKIAADKTVLREYELNPLYKPYGIRATGKQNIGNGEIDKNSLRLIEIIDYRHRADEDYLDRLIKKASESWKGVTNANDWLSQNRY
ncbi:MAG: hypothetical protein R2682_03440 [Pyrinomonadaceae bacterium]